jgi:hypothetical protein
LVSASCGKVFLGAANAAKTEETRRQKVIQRASWRRAAAFQARIRYRAGGRSSPPPGDFEQVPLAERDLMRRMLGAPAKVPSGRRTDYI